MSDDHIADPTDASDAAAVATSAMPDSAMPDSAPGAVTLCPAEKG